MKTEKPVVQSSCEDWSKLSSLANSANAETLHLFVEELSKNDKVPLICDSTKVYFLYKGIADSVQWMGDFNSWGKAKSIDTKGTRLGERDLWVWETEFPKDARLDYKIVVDGEWIIDPLNERQQWAGINGGQPNSSLQMPAWKADKEMKRQAYMPEGQLSEAQLIPSVEMGYAIQYSVYTPYNYKTETALPCLYVLDGQEYADEQLGSMINTLNNLIAKKKIEPLVVVFIDPRNPSNLKENRRESEFRFNNEYTQFLTQELIPEIEESYKVSSERMDRGLLGTSYGGLCVAYNGVYANNTFGKLGIHSPAFWYEWPKIKETYQTDYIEATQVVMTSGTFYDGKENTLEMKELMESKQFQVKYYEVNEGHSWGNWSALTNEVLEGLFGKNE